MTQSELFTAPWDHRLTVITVVVSSIMALGAGAALWAGLTVAPSWPARIVTLGGAALTVVIFLSGFLLAPRGYTIADGRLTIDRYLRPIEIPLASISAVEPLPAQSVSGALRTLGSGGFFGYYGRFRNRALGSFRMYATRGDGYVLVRAAKPYVLTPDSPQRFIETLNRDRAAAGSGGR